MRTTTSKVSGTSFLSLLLMLACCGLLVGESADPDCAGLSRLECIHASLGGRRPAIREVELPMTAAAFSPATVGRADPLFVDIWTHQATQKYNSLPSRMVHKVTAPGDRPSRAATPEDVRLATVERAEDLPRPAAADLIAMLKVPRPKPLQSAPAPEITPKAKRTAVAAPTVSTPSTSSDDVQSPKKKKKKKAKRKRLKPPDEEAAFSAAKEIPPRRNFSRQEAERLNNAAWTPDW